MLTSLYSLSAVNTQMLGIHNCFYLGKLDFVCLQPHSVFGVISTSSVAVTSHWQRYIHDGFKFICGSIDADTTLHVLRSHLNSAALHHGYYFSQDQFSYERVSEPEAKE